MKKTDIGLDQVLKALGDPVRLSVIQQLLSSKSHEMTCGSFEHGLTKATFSHHIKILQDAQIIHKRDDGTKKMISICPKFEKRLPALLHVIAEA